MLKAKLSLTAVVATAAFSTASGCESCNNEVEIVAPEASIPVMNPNPKAPMAGINETNEYQHPDVLKGSIVTPGQPR